LNNIYYLNPHAYIQRCIRLFKLLKSHLSKHNDIHMSCTRSYIDNIGTLKIDGKYVTKIKQNKK